MKAPARSVLVGKMKVAVLLCIYWPTPQIYLETKIEEESDFCKYVKNTRSATCYLIYVVPSLRQLEWNPG